MNLTRTNHCALFTERRKLLIVAATTTTLLLGTTHEAAALTCDAMLPFINWGDLPGNEWIYGFRSKPTSASDALAAWPNKLLAQEGGVLVAPGKQSDWMNLRISDPISELTVGPDVDTEHLCSTTAAIISGCPNPTGPFAKNRLVPDYGETYGGLVPETFAVRAGMGMNFAHPERAWLARMNQVLGDENQPVTSDSEAPRTAYPVAAASSAEPVIRGLLRNDIEDTIKAGLFKIIRDYQEASQPRSFEEERWWGIWNESQVEVWQAERNGDDSQLQRAEVQLEDAEKNLSRSAKEEMERQAQKSELPSYEVDDQVNERERIQFSRELDFNINHRSVVVPAEEDPARMDEIGRTS